jgi:pSer/pThr/pTyr-binding forkhead associated (FHA) protein
MQVSLVMFRSNGDRKTFPLSRDVTVIGRREDCHLRIPLSDVSRKHCRFIADGQSVRVEDLGSSNGTFLNDERIQEAEVSPGDIVTVGPVKFVVQIDGNPQEDQIQPPSSKPASAPPSQDNGPLTEDDLIAFDQDRSEKQDENQIDLGLEDSDAGQNNKT